MVSVQPSVASNSTSDQCCAFGLDRIHPVGTKLPCGRFRNDTKTMVKSSERSVSLSQPRREARMASTLFTLPQSLIPLSADLLYLQRKPRSGSGLSICISLDRGLNLYDVHQSITSRRACSLHRHRRILRDGESRDRVRDTSQKVSYFTSDQDG